VAPTSKEKIATQTKPDLIAGITVRASLLIGTQMPKRRKRNRRGINPVLDRQCYFDL
jgi:hypothetical protein